MVLNVYFDSPKNGQKLHQVAEHLYFDGEHYWPYIDHILYARDKDNIRLPAVEQIKNGNTEEALRILLTDQDPFAPLPPPNATALRKLTGSKKLRLNEAMRLLNYGGVADYFAHRWTTPTFLTGLSLLQMTLKRGYPLIDVACGIGHFLRTAEANGTKAIGLDLVFSKLWIARQYMNIRGPLICTDISTLSCLSVDFSTVVYCHDAFYFFKDKESILRDMRALAQDGNVIVGHAHTDQENEYTNGFPLSYSEYDAIAHSKSRWFTDEALLEIWFSQQTNPQIRISKKQLSSAKALSWIEGTIDKNIHPLSKYAGVLSLNPMLRTNSEQVYIDWPSDSFKNEYRSDINYILDNLNTVEPLTVPEKLSEHEQQHYFKKRILLDIPELW